MFCCCNRKGNKKRGARKFFQHLSLLQRGGGGWLGWDGTPSQRPTLVSYIENHTEAILHAVDEGVLLQKEVPNRKLFDFRRVRRRLRSPGGVAVRVNDSTVLLYLVVREGHGFPCRRVWSLLGSPIESRSRDAINGSSSCLTCADERLHITSLRGRNYRKTATKPPLSSFIPI